eukprot:CAMPEP_0194095682 /NCGR_PEP_ID=MMETSP0149-20130528/56950_1 /TAXON_ID=122233 /ORGANISM="Chaetoceros debilis, Strain MM31A-1" /LENGTH=1881 /DNA_ID=CAMNT_0038781633 /DNA_START=538 /DNA_END=6183 /DNA_ORIENTATION=+
MTMSMEQNIPSMISPERDREHIPIPGITSTGSNISTGSINSTVRLRIALSRSNTSALALKEKASCEYYTPEDEDDLNLKDGELPRLGGNTNTNTGMMPHTSSMSIQSDMIEVASQPMAMAVTPSPRNHNHNHSHSQNRDNNNRALTPVQSNKHEKEKKLIGSFGKGIRSRLSRRSTKKQQQQMEKEEKEYVTYIAPRLSPETKRRHRVFWTQLDVEDDGSASASASEFSDTGGKTTAAEEKQLAAVVARSRGRERHEVQPQPQVQVQPQVQTRSRYISDDIMMPDDERADRRAQAPISTSPRLSERQTETIEDESNDGNNPGIGGNLYNIMSELCSDCGHMVTSGIEGDSNNTNSKPKNNSSRSVTNENVNVNVNAKPIVSSTSDSFRMDMNTPTPQFDFEEDADASTIEGGDEDEDEDDDESTIASLNRNSPQRYAHAHAHARGRSPQSRGSTVGSTQASSTQSTNQSQSLSQRYYRSTDNFENTAIEVEYVASHAQSDEEEDQAIEKTPDPGFLQLDSSGEVSNFVRPHDKAQSEVGVGGSSPKRAYAMSKTQSWSGEDKNAYLTAMAKRAKEDYRRKKARENGGVVSVVPTDEVYHDIADDVLREVQEEEETTTLDGILNKSAQSAPSPSAPQSSPQSQGEDMPRSKSFGGPSPNSQTQSQSPSAHELGAPTFKSSNTKKNVNMDVDVDVDADFTSPSGVTEFPPVNLYQSNTTSDLSRATHTQPIGLKRVAKSDVSYMSNGNNTGRRGVFSSLRKKGGFNKVDAAFSNNNGKGNGFDSAPRDRDRDRDSDREGQVESPYDFQPSGGSIISKKSRGMGRFKKWQQIDDGEMPNENLNAHLNFGTTSSRRNVPENVETNIPRLGDELFDFGENTNGNTNAKQQNQHSSANAHLNSPMHSVKLDPYEDSCDVSVLGSMMGGGDDGSFFSARTSGTYGTYNTYGSINTTGTNASVSTRRRHRGAAKKKLGESLNGHGNGTANGKSQPSGWLESIKAAAETTNRKWDPKVGWIDYTPTANGNMKDMERDTRPDKSRIGRLKAPSFKKMSHGNGKSSRSSLDDDNDDDDKSVKSNVPFPHDWEAARDNMVRSYKTPIDRDKDKAQDKAQDKDDYSVAEASAKTEVRSNTKLPPPTENPPPMEIETTLTGIGITSNDYKHDYIVLGANETIQEESEEEPDSPSPRVQVFDNKEVTNNKGISSLMDEESNEDDISDDVDLNPIRKDEATASVSSGKQEVIAPPRNSLMNWVDCGTSQVSLSVKSRASGASNNMYPAVPKSPIPSSPKSTASKSQVTSRSHNQPQPRSTEDSGYAQFPAYEGKGSAGHMDVDSHPGASEVDRSRNISGDDNDNDDIDGSYDEDEFGQNHDSFDFSNTDSKELDASDDGFKVVKSIDSATARSITSKDSNSPLEAKIGKAKAKGHSKTHAYSPSSRDSRKRSSQVPRSPSSPEDDKTTFSVATANSMSSKAKDWLKRVEMQKQKSALSNNNSRSKPQAEEPSASALFVSAADDASTFEYGNNRSEQEGENDTVFDFEEPRSSKSKNYTRKQGETAAPPFKQQERQRQRQQGRQRENQEKRGRNLNNDSMSEITAPSEVSSFASKRRPQVQSFLSRLQSCTSPTFEDQDGNGNGNSNSNMPSAHLAFLKKSAQDTVNCAPTGAAAGGQGIIDLLQAQTFCGTTGAGAGGASTTSGLPPLAPSAAGSGTNKGKGSIASSYLQAIKERSTGTGSISGKTSSGAERSPSVASTTSSKSETWQKFLEKRNQALESTSRRSLTPSQSKAAEKYAAQKLEEIMKEASAVPDNGNDDDDDSKRSKSTTKLRPPSSTAGMLPRSKSTGRPQMDRRLSRKYALSRNEAAKAAQDLAAARVEAMMAMTSSTRLEEGEI